MLPHVLYDLFKGIAEYWLECLEFQLGVNGC